MRPSFYPRFVNTAFGDPALFVDFQFEKRALLFDIGDIRSLSAKDILKIRHVFVSHTHLDHFIGFDHLLRICLGRNKSLWIYGPKGLIGNLSGKVSAYTWNLVDNYPYSLKIVANEIHDGTIRRVFFSCREKFLLREMESSIIRDNIIWEEPAVKVRIQVLDHGIPCLGFRMEERFHVNIRKDALDDLGLSPGRWLTGFKDALFQKTSPTTPFIVAEKDGTQLEVPLAELTEKIAIITPGQVIAYIADAGYTPENREKMLYLAKNADILYIEAAFSEKEADTAREKKHLTAKQAGTIAREAGAKQFRIFHFSPRYMGMESALHEEARAAFDS